jgi:hypothetical protein
MKGETKDAIDNLNNKLEQINNKLKNNNNSQGVNRFEVKELAKEKIKEMKDNGFHFDFKSCADCPECCKSLQNLIDKRLVKLEVVDKEDLKPETEDDDWF